MLRPFTNSEILNRIKYDASADYNRRVPAATQENISETLKALTSYSPAWNEFSDALINRVGGFISRDTVWNNPLAVFKQNTLQYGDTIEEAKTGLVRAVTYNPNEDAGEKELFGTVTPDVQTQFHTVNRRDRYKITVNDSLLRNAFLEESGLQKFVNQVLNAPLTSDQYDEFQLMCRLLTDYEAGGGFWHTQVPDVRSLGASEENVKTFIKKVQAAAGELQFLDNKYVASRMPAWAGPEDLILLATPRTMASVNVEAWAAAFNLDKAQMRAQIIQLPERSLPDAKTQAILTTKDFFVVADQKVENTSMYNPASLSTNYWLHHWEVISASLFVPAINFWTGGDDESVKIVPTDIEIVADKWVKADGSSPSQQNKVKPGEICEILYHVVGKNLPDDYQVPVDFYVEGNKSARTRAYNDGTIVVGSDETSSSINVTFKPVHANLKAAAGGKKAGGEATWTLYIDAPAKGLWPKK